jgi:CRISPR-associated endonuclease Cas1
MAASHTLPHSHAIRKSGVLVLNGYGIRVQVNAGHLLLHDGIADERRTIRLPRVNHGLKRLVMIGSDGFITLEALRWLADHGAAFVMLDRRGQVLAVTGPVSPSDAKLRRAAALALGNGTALKISKELISQKLAGQELLVRDMLHDSATADAIARFKDELPGVVSIESVRIIEALAAKKYWSAWADVPVRWPRKDERRVPEHWKRFGSRISPLTHSPRLAANPPNACMNLLHALGESECRLALTAMGLDADIGMLHVDTPNRSSAACDLQEVIRPKIDAFVLNWIQSEPFRKSDFDEDRSGCCRLSSFLAIKLCKTANTWQRLAAPVAEWLAQELWSSIPKPTSRLPRLRLASRLTQAHRRTVKGSIVPEVNQPKPEHVCSDCGVKISIRTKLCSKCAKRATRKSFRVGRRKAQHPESLAKRSAKQRQHKQAIQNWKPSDQPVWLTRDVYVKQVQPALASVAKPRIRSAIGISEPYSSDIQAGKRIPHPRHWQELARLVGASPDAD